MSTRFITIIKILFWADIAACITVFSINYPKIELSAILAIAIVCPVMTIGPLALPVLIIFDLY